AMFVAQGGKVVVADGGIHWTRESYYGWEPPGTHPSGTQVHEVLTEIFPVTVSHYLPYTGRWPHRWGTNIGFPTPFTPSEPFDLSNTNTYFWWYRNPAGVWSMAYEGGEPWLLDNGLDFGYEPRVRSVAEGYHALVGSAFCYQLALADWPEHKSGYGKYLINCLNFSGMADPPEIEIGEVESQNTPPVADASATPIEVISPNNVDAIVTLDGSRSFDLDEDPLDFFWFADEDLVTPIATTEIATVPLGVGVHDILLVVDDSIDTADDLITVNVITASEGTQDLSDLVSDLSIPAGTQSQLNASLEAASASFDRQNMTAGVNQLQAFQNKVAAQAGKKIDPLTAALLIEEAQRIIDAVSGG
ncbi:MAG: hypothetical protein H8E44_35735, partial [Planctomycetes bacterium]|nr:hypothetical protein [Planctomycetota bacterium]